MEVTQITANFNNSLTHCLNNLNLSVDRYNYCSIGDLSMTSAIDITPKGDGGVLKEIIKAGTGNVPEKGSKVFGTTEFLQVH